MKAFKPSTREDLHTISLLVTNKPGVLVRVSVAFARRGFNIEALVVSPAFDGRYSRMTITAQGDRKTLEQIIKQAEKLVDVVSAQEHTSENSLETELALIKIIVKEKERTGVLQIVDHYKAQTVDLTNESLIVQVTGSTEKLDAMLYMLDQYQVKEVVRTGKIVVARGDAKT